MPDPLRAAELLEGFVERLGSASIAYSGVTEEFLSSISDPNAGSIVNAPDNWAMAELVIRDVPQKLWSAALSVDEMRQLLGRPSLFPPEFFK